MDTQQKHQASTEVQAGTQPEGLAWTILDVLNSRICVLDSNQKIVACNRAWHEFPPATTCPHTPAAGDHSELRQPWGVPCWSAAEVARVDQAIRDLRSGKQDRFALEYECSGCGYPRWYRMHIRCFPGDNCGRLLIKIDDITEHRQADQAQHLAALRLKQLGAHLESVREEQSAAVARELHDELGGLMTMLKLDMATTMQQVAQTQAMRDKLASLVDQVSTALQVIKRISSNLRPATLDTLGLMATIRWYVERFSRATGIATQLHLPDYVRLSEISSIAMFRIFQEGLTNVATHSGASKVSIQVEKIDSELILEIIDNGHGISAEQLQNPGSFGIIGMSERAHYLGGQLCIKGVPNDGTRLRLSIPMDS